MKQRTKSYLLSNRWQKIKKINGFITIFLLLTYQLTAQIANYVNNGGFETLSSTTLTSYFSAATYWQPIDTNKYAYFLYSTIPQISSAPYCSQGFQMPRNGNNFIAPVFYCTFCPQYNSRGYPRNRLKQKLAAGKTYCAKFYLVNTNNSPLAINSFGMFFADSNIDTISYCGIPLDYITPQVQHNGFITDTLNWVPITGTFVAGGNEKYMVLGNFKSDVATNTLLLNPTFSSTPGSDVYIDDVSLIELDLPAFAGKDTSCIPGTTVYIGRTRDVGIDEACTWFKWPDMVTPIATGVAGLTVSPVQTTTYIVKQQLWCSGIKYDTVVVYKDGVGIDEWGFDSAQPDIRVWPNPVDAVLIIETQRHKDAEAQREGFRLQIVNSLGQIIREEEFKFLNNKAQIQTSDLPKGVYILHLKSGNSNTVSKRFVVAR